jgi:hypothetical protein
MRKRLAADEAAARNYQELGLAWLERQAEVVEELVAQRNRMIENRRGNMTGWLGDSNSGRLLGSAVPRRLPIVLVSEATNRPSRRLHSVEVVSAGVRVIMVMAAVSQFIVHMVLIGKTRVVVLVVG